MSHFCAAPSDTGETVFLVRHLKRRKEIAKLLEMLTEKQPTETVNIT